MPKHQVPVDDAAEIPTFGPPMPARRGSVADRHMKCGKPGCPCAHDRSARHGPYPSLARRVDGRTQTRFLSQEEAEVARRQVADGRRLRERFEAYLKDCERCADQELEAIRAARAQASERGGSTRRSPRRLRPRSTS
jgi:hypothetical protein